MIHILVVEDDPNIRKLIEDVLLDEKYTPVLVKDAQEALEIIDHRHIDLMITDIMMPGTALNACVAAQNVARLLGHKDGATTLRFYAHYINTEAMIQLEELEQQNITHLGITAGELEKIVMGASEVLEKSSVTERINEARIGRAKNFPPKKA